MSDATHETVGTYGLMAEFDSPKALIAACEAAREAGYTKLDAYTPYPIEAVWEALYFDSAQYRRFNGYWVGPYCLGSISFGEQEVQLEGITNHRTGREYTARYLCQVFQDEGFCVSDCGRYAYLDLSHEGVYIDFRDFEKETIFKALEAAKAGGLF